MSMLLILPRELELCMRVQGLQSQRGMTVTNSILRILTYFKCFVALVFCHLYGREHETHNILSLSGFFSYIVLMITSGRFSSVDLRVLDY